MGTELDNVFRELKKSIKGKHITYNEKKIDKAVTDFKLASEQAILNEMPEDIKQKGEDSGEYSGYIMNATNDCIITLNDLLEDCFK